MTQSKDQRDSAEETRAEPASAPNEAPPGSEKNGAPEPKNTGERTPAKVFSYLVGQEAYVQASVWEREVTRRDGTKFLTFDVSVRKRYRDTRDGEWKSLYAFHASEVYVVCYALQQAAAFVTELRAGTPDA